MRRLPNFALHRMTRCASVAVLLILALAPQVTRGAIVDKCQAAKIKAVGKKTFDQAKCREKALKKGVAIDPLCFTKAEANFVKAMTKADTLGACPGTATDLDAAVDQCVADYVALLTDVTGTTTTTTFAGNTTTTTTMPGGCPIGQTTSVSGRVYAPNGTLPIPNALVYVPEGPVGSLPAGVTCDRCGTVLGATPLVQTVSDATGHFMLPGVPAGANVPLVIQIGKWRRQVLLANVPACVDTPISTDQTRLPKNRGEGDIPLIAVSTGGADALECLLRKLGIDDSEFTTPPGLGRIHLFAGSGGTDQFDAGVGGGRPFVSSTALWASPASLEPYDVVLLSCEGSEFPQTKPRSALDAVKDYADSGGRVFMEHWHNYWLTGGLSTPGGTPWPFIVSFANLSAPPPFTANVDTTSAHGTTFADWLVAVHGSTARGEIFITDPKVTAVGVNANLAERLIYKDANPLTVQYLAFTTPVEQPAANHCGRVVFSDLHLSSGDASADSLTFPSGGCLSSTATMSPKELVLAFMVFDISSCVSPAAP